MIQHSECTDSQACTVEVHILSRLQLVIDVCTTATGTGATGIGTVHNFLWLSQKYLSTACTSLPLTSKYEGAGCEHRVLASIKLFDEIGRKFRTDDNESIWNSHDPTP